MGGLVSSELDLRTWSDKLILAVMITEGNKQKRQGPFLALPSFVMRVKRDTYRLIRSGASVYWTLVLYEWQVASADGTKCLWN